MCRVKFDVPFFGEVFRLSLLQDNGINTVIVSSDGMGGLVDNAVAEGSCLFKPPTKGMSQY